MTAGRGRASRGGTLPMAIFAIVIIGALVSGGFLIGFEEHRIGRAVLEQEQAFRAAEGGARQVIAAWAPGAFATLGIGDSAPLPRRWDGNGRFEGSVRRLGPRVFMARVRGYSEGGRLAQQVGMFLRTVPVAPAPSTPVIVAGAFRGNPDLVDRRESAPDGWSDCPPGDSAGALATPDSATQPATVADRILAGSTSAVTGTSIFPWPSVSGGACQQSDRINWGDPTDQSAPCGSYRPVVSLRGSGTGPVEIAGGQGQGVVVANGDLELRGGFVFAGLLVVRGTLSVSGGASVYGAVLAGNVDLSGAGPGPAIAWSKCAVLRALDGSTRVEPLYGRSWFKVF